MSVIICVCNAVSEKQIREAIRGGASSIGDLRAQTGCATNCGSCVDMAISLLDEHRSEGPGHALDILNLHNLSPA
ncbi:MAG: (2Fe-2S)-binding protein [Pseudomonadota bacterium]